MPIGAIGVLERMEAFAKRMVSGTAATAATSAFAAYVGRAAGLGVAGSDFAVADVQAVLLFGIVFLIGVGRRHGIRNDQGLQFACDAVTAVGAAVVFFVAPDLMRI
jgi:hypothetical protein